MPTHESYLQIIFIYLVFTTISFSFLHVQSILQLGMYIFLSLFIFFLAVQYICMYATGYTVWNGRWNDSLPRFFAFAFLFSWYVRHDKSSRLTVRCFLEKKIFRRDAERKKEDKYNANVNNNQKCFFTHFSLLGFHVT